MLLLLRPSILGHQGECRGEGSPSPPALNLLVEENSLDPTVGEIIDQLPVDVAEYLRLTSP